MSPEPTSPLCLAPFHMLLRRRNATSFVCPRRGERHTFHQTTSVPRAKPLLPIQNHQTSIVIPFQTFNRRLNKVKEVTEGNQHFPLRNISPHQFPSNRRRSFKPLNLTNLHLRRKRSISANSPFNKQTCLTAHYASRGVNVPHYQNPPSLNCPPKPLLIRRFSI